MWRQKYQRLSPAEETFNSKAEKKINLLARKTLFPASDALNWYLHLILTFDTFTWYLHLILTFQSGRKKSFSWVLSDQNIFSTRLKTNKVMKVWRVFVLIIQAKVTTTVVVNHWFFFNVQSLDKVNLRPLLDVLSDSIWVWLRFEIPRRPDPDFPIMGLMLKSQ